MNQFEYFVNHWLGTTVIANVISDIKNWKQKYWLLLKLERKTIDKNNESFIMMQT